MRALYLSHPQVRMDPAVPVPLWGLSAEGRGRAEAFVGRGVVPVGAMVFSSRETKALELAELVAAAAGTPVFSDHLMGENDRSATGFLPPALFEEHADRFFAQPQQSVEGWERAIDAQARVVSTVRTALASVPPGVPVIFCGHGAVGTLLKCRIGSRRISRDEDQSRIGVQGGGNGFVFDLAARQLLTDWTPMEDIPHDWFA
ncbi:histidine phosphatase family protein [Devosia sp. XJ19-1]|uniref:Histidine phosphatase family protein n=1 Tax=Devosia ureilytica TaxID=2952754 RepID=A0A9Q4AN90_9HYPH|nr:histidine phosphatase family protein [Devosia ureilytica]MCP8882926.1 histidine phosphatase family protein [Devosia ureilytica]MCP8886706.1 histidine phosphatase family protein [Devosia ureilytica]